MVGTDQIMSLATGQEEANRVAQGIDQSMDLGAQPAVIGARFAANASDALVFSSPIATFRDRNGAAERGLACGLAISVDLDTGNTIRARERLEGLLGPATMVVASGGIWTDPKTGEVFLKLHLHWRLSEPTRDPDDHARLKLARRLACALVGADGSGQSPVHPLRWPGTWHRKDIPQLARIIARNPGAEVHLPIALDALETAVEMRWTPFPGQESG